MNDVQVFENSDFGKIRATRGEDGEPMFVAKDVCSVLGISKYRDAMASLDEDEGCPVIVDTPGGKQQMTAVTEPGFYKLVMRSRKPEAKAFKRWVTINRTPKVTGKGQIYFIKRYCPKQLA